MSSLTLLHLDAVARIASDNANSSDVDAYLAGRSEYAEIISRALGRPATERELIEAGLDCAYAWQDQRDRRAADRTATDSY
jgi:hypothetical protein